MWALNLQAEYFVELRACVQYWLYVHAISMYCILLCGIFLLNACTVIIPETHSVHYLNRGTHVTVLVAAFFSQKNDSDIWIMFGQNKEFIPFWFVLMTIVKTVDNVEIICRIMAIVYVWCVCTIAVNISTCLLSWLQCCYGYFSAHFTAINSWHGCFKLHSSFYKSTSHVSYMFCFVTKSFWLVIISQNHRLDSQVLLNWCLLSLWKL